MIETSFVITKYPENLQGLNDKLENLIDGFEGITLSSISAETLEYNCIIYSDTELNPLMVSTAKETVSNWLENPEPELKPEDKATELQNIINALLGVE